MVLENLIFVRLVPDLHYEIVEAPRIYALVVRHDFRIVILRISRRKYISTGETTVNYKTYFTLTGWLLLAKAKESKRRVTTDARASRPTFQH